MPPDIKKAAVALVISCISALIAVYFDGRVSGEKSFSDPFTLGMNAVWVLVIAWIIWDLFKGKNIKPTLVLVGAIMLTFLIWDFVESGFGMAQVFYTAELLMFVFAYFLVTSKESKAWYSANDL